MVGGLSVGESASEENVIDSIAAVNRFPVEKCARGKKISEVPTPLTGDSTESAGVFLIECLMLDRS